jgi:hypothetical protein
MQYAERLPTLPSPRTLVAPVVALIVGAGVATGAYALLDDDNAGSPAAATKVIVAEPPVQPGDGVAAKNEAGVAAAVGQAFAGAGTEAKDEAGTAAALGQAHGGTSSGSEMKDEAGTAAALGQAHGGTGGSE